MCVECYVLIFKDLLNEIDKGVCLVIFEVCGYIFSVDLFDRCMFNWSLLLVLELRYCFYCLIFIKKSLWFKFEIEDLWYDIESIKRKIKEEDVILM